MNALTATLPALRLHFGQIASSWFGGLGDPPAGPKEQPPSPTHLLRPLDTVAIETGRSRQVTCVDGCVLLQYQGHPRADIILVRGESHRCEPEARLTVLAFVATALSVE